jgi:GH15 family glucan-1,4-alpha-glucosidase
VRIHDHALCSTEAAARDGSPGLQTWSDRCIRVCLVRIEDYAIVGDTQTIALIGRDGSVDWLCLPRFDSGACFASLLGEPDHGRWLITPQGKITASRRQYRGDTLILEQELDTEDGTVRLIDFMPIRAERPDMVRIVEGVSGRVPMKMELIVRYDYGCVMPWVRKVGGRFHAVAGPDALALATPVPLTGKGFTTVAEFVIEPGDRVPFSLTWHSSYEPLPAPPDPEAALTNTERWWKAWSSRIHARGPYREAIIRSLLTLKALTYAPSGGIVAAGTTSLPEILGGVRNWDYRYCWLRDATFTLQAMLHSGFRDEAKEWRDWLFRAVAGDPAKLQIMYAVNGSRRIDERELEWLPGYEGSKPVRIGNAAVNQLQLDVYGEVIDMLFQARTAQLGAMKDTWSLESKCLEWLEKAWDQPDEGMWEVRGGRQQFTYSKVMVWAAFDRAVKTVERFGAHGPLDRWRQIRDKVHADVCRFSYDADRNAFTQAYGSKKLDASLLLMPVVGFLPPDDPRLVGTIEAIQRELVVDGLVFRYRTDDHANIDGMPGREGAFFACSFWLCDALVLIGRQDEARGMFDRLLALRNDVGLLSEEYDPRSKRMVGNFPQAFSHVAMINSARNLCEPHGPARQRANHAPHATSGDTLDDPA